MGEHRRERETSPPTPVGYGVGHGHGHSHGHGVPPDVEVPRGPRIAVIATLATVLVAVLAGLVAFWPDGDTVDEVKGAVSFATDEVEFPHATVLAVEDCPAAQEGSRECATLRVEVDDGPEVRVQVTADVAESGLSAGDRVQLQQHQPAGGETTYTYYKTDRGLPLALLAGLFVLVVLLVARWRGLLALIGLGFGGLVIGGWLLPALLAGEPPIAVGLVGSAAILYVVLYLAHGVSMRTSAALLGTLGGLLITAFLGWLSVRQTHLSGVADESGGLLSQVGADLAFQGLLICTIIIAGLGVLNDVTITQASAVWELRAASPQMSRRRLWTSAMRIGRDHIASTIYTIVFAYAGTALMTLLVISLYERSVLELIGTEQLAEEVVRSLVSSIGLVLAVPLTTLIAALTVTGPRPAADSTTLPEEQP